MMHTCTLNVISRGIQFYIFTLVFVWQPGHSSLQLIFFVKVKAQFCARGGMKKIQHRQ